VILEIIFIWIISPQVYQVIIHGICQIRKQTFKTIRVMENHQHRMNVLLTFTFQPFLKSVATLMLLCIAVSVVAQPIAVKFKPSDPGHLVNREAQVSAEGVVELNAKPGDGMLVVKDLRFADGTIQLKLKGENKQGASFIGVAFNIRDEKRYDAIYFRPFNFKNPQRQTHSVQYISMPDHPWEALRSKFPGKYENKIESAPDPDGWFNAKIIVEGKTIKVYVNDASTPSLTVESLAEIDATAIALWVGNNSKGSFRELVVTSGR
jgi:hypothetical protein